MSSSGLHTAPAWEAGLGVSKNQSTKVYSSPITMFLLWSPGTRWNLYCEFDKLIDEQVTGIISGFCVKYSDSNPDWDMSLLSTESHLLCSDGFFMHLRYLGCDRITSQKSHTNTLIRR